MIIIALIISLKPLKVSRIKFYVLIVVFFKVFHGVYPWLYQIDKMKALRLDINKG